MTSVSFQYILASSIFTNQEFLPRRRERLALIIRGKKRQEIKADCAYSLVYGESLDDEIWDFPGGQF